jgi:hypothetical protein
MDDSEKFNNMYHFQVYGLMFLEAQYPLMNSYIWRY